MTTSDIQCKHGLIRVINEDIWVSRSLKELGEYSETELNFIRMVLSLQGHPQALTVVEAGAYIGDMTVPLSRICKKVIAFEPQHEAREILEHNLQVNGCTNVEVLPYALGHENGEAHYTQNDPDSPGSTMITDREVGEAVEVRTLDSLGLGRVDFLKADVEGMEVLLLAGSQETIAQYRPVLFLERDTVGLGGQITIPEALGLLGYDTYPLSFMMWQEDNFRKAPNTFGMTASFMSLGVPRS